MKPTVRKEHLEGVGLCTDSACDEVTVRGRQQEVAGHQIGGGVIIREEEDRGGDLRYGRRVRRWTDRR
jgi:hypothetical protein